MDIGNVVKITDDVRSKLSIIFNSQFSEIENNISYLLTYPIGEYAHEFDYHNIFQPGHNNLVRTCDSKPMMSVFNFSSKHILRIYRLLGIEQYKPLMNGIRVYPNTTVPMHTDLNKGEIGREMPILSIVVNGDDGMVFMSNRKDGTRQIGIPGKTEFIMYPTLMAHGALSKTENYDLIQIQLTNMV
jgi:hypothetical protein